MSQKISHNTSTGDLFLRVLATSRLFRVLFPNRVRFNKVYFHRGQNRYPQRVSQPEGVHFLHFASKGVASVYTTPLWHTPPPHLSLGESRWQRGDAAHCGSVRVSDVTWYSVHHLVQCTPLPGTALTSLCYNCSRST